MLKMAGKAKKTSSWFQCEKCQANLVQKDLDQHTNNCPPSQEVYVHPFVLNGKIVGPLDIKTNEDIKGLDFHEKNNLLFLSQSVIQLCNLVIGDWCLLRQLNNVPAAKIVWPTTEKSINSILLTQSAYDLYWRNTLNVKVAVSKLNTSDCLVAKQIILVALNTPRTLQLTSELQLRIKKLHLNRYVTEGNKLSCIFYGKNLEFLVKKVDVVENVNAPTSIANSTGSVKNLGIEFEKLDIKPEEDQQATSDSSEEKSPIEPVVDDTISLFKFYKIVDATVFKLFGSDKELTPIRQINPLLEIGGYESEIEEILELIDIGFHRIPGIQGLQINRGLLLHGAAGTGKTLIANAVAETSRCNTIISLNGSDLYAKFSGSIEEAIVNYFNDALNRPPSIILLDEIDVLCPVRNSKITEQEKRVVSTLLTQIDRLNSAKNENCKVIIVATTNKLENVDSAFRRNGRLDREIEISIPSPNTRYKILKKLLARTNANVSDDDALEIANTTHGFVGSDLTTLVSRAGLYAIKRNGVEIVASDLKYAMTKIQPTAMRAIQIEVPNVQWSDIGGQEKLKLILKQAVEWPLRYADSFTRLGISPPRGVLMYGPPGCSKTMIAKALATESGLNFLSIKGPELFSKYVGESERAVRDVFRKARQVAPSIVFFDEIDALGGERSTGPTSTSGGTSVQERVLAQLLTELDGITPLKDVTIVAATNRPDRIDRALIRPGRLDRIVYVPLPDDATRRDIFRIKLVKMPTEPAVDVDALVRSTENYSGAEIQAVCHEAAMKSLEENIQAQEIKWAHFLSALEIITPRTPKSLLDICEQFSNTNLNK